MWKPNSIMHRGKKFLQNVTEEIICQRDFNKEYFVNEMMQDLADRLFLERIVPHTFWPMMDLTFSPHSFRRVDKVF
jgi:hypothetical protein